MRGGRGVRVDGVRQCRATAVWARLGQGCGGLAEFGEGHRDVGGGVVLDEGGEVAASEAVKKGEWKGADYTFKSVVTRFGSKEQNYGGGGAPVPARGILGGLAGSFSVKKSENEVQIDWRIVDNATREVVKGASGSAVGVEKGGGFNFGSWGGHGFAGDRGMWVLVNRQGTWQTLAVDPVTEQELSSDDLERIYNYIVK